MPTQMLSRVRSFLNFMDKERSPKQAFVILTAIITIALFPLISANFSYIDDLARVMWGGRGWENFGRYLSNFFAILIHADTTLSDISPLPQLIAIIILAFTGLVAIRIVSDSQREMKGYTLWQLIATLPMFLSPWFLECLSYKFDAPYIAFSVLASVFPMTLYRHSWRYYFPALIFGTLVVCTTYQVSLAITMILFCFLVFKQIILGTQKKLLNRYIIVSFAGIGIALLFFKSFLMPDISYVDYFNPSLPSFTEILPNICKNLVHYSKLMYADLDKHHKWICLAFFLFTSFMYTVWKSSHRKKIKTFALTICTLCCMYICSFGIYPLIKEPIFFPRSMYGIGAFIAVICLYISSCQKKYLPKIVVIIFSWTIVVFTCVYGNALSIQSEYINFRTQLLLTDLNSLEIPYDGKDKEVVFRGAIYHAPALQKTMKLYPILKRLVPPCLVDNVLWTSRRIFVYYGVKNMHETTSEIALHPEKIKEYPVLKDTIYHTITGDKDRLVIYLK